MAIEKFLSLLATHLRNVADNIEAGNSNMSEEEAVSLLENIRRVTDRKEIMSKYEACRYLNVGRSTFDGYVRSGELPRGVRKPGFKNILFLKKDLDLFIKKKREKHSKKDSSICL